MTLLPLLASPPRVHWCNSFLGSLREHILDVRQVLQAHVRQGELTHPVAPGPMLEASSHVRRAFSTSAGEPVADNGTVTMGQDQGGVVPKVEEVGPSAEEAPPCLPIPAAQHAQQISSMPGLCDRAESVRLIASSPGGQPEVCADPLLSNEEDGV